MPLCCTAQQLMHCHYSLYTQFPISAHALTQLPWHGTFWLEETSSLITDTMHIPVEKDTETLLHVKPSQQKDTHCNAEERAEKCLVGASSRNQYFIQLV